MVNEKLLNKAEEDGRIPYDDYLRDVGEFGKWQRFNWFLICLVGVMSAFSSMIWVFVASVPIHHCKSEFAGYFPENVSTEQMYSLLYPHETGDSSSNGFSKCKMYIWNHTLLNSTLEWVLVKGSHDESVLSSLPVEKCSDWEFDRSEYIESIVSEWNLVCGREWIRATVASLYAGGNLVSSLVCGYIADRFGRRIVLVACMLLKGIAGTAAAFSPGPWTYIAGEAIVALASQASFQIGFILVSEIVGPSWKLFATSSVSMFWVLGYLLVALVAYFIRDWFYLQLALHIPIALTGFLYLWLLPESPRWLLQKGKNAEAQNILRKMAKCNGMDTTLNVELVAVSVVKKEKVTLTALTKSDHLVVFTMLCCFMWFAANFAYYGLSLNTSNLGGNPYLNFAIAGAVELPAYLVAWFLLKLVGRRSSVIAFYLTCGIFLCLTLPIPDELYGLRVAFAMIGKFAVTSVFSMIYVYTIELYPTTKRSAGLGLASAVARVGSIIAPYFVIIGQMTSKEVPLVAMGVVAIVAGLLPLMLPETKNLTLPDTMDDIRKFKNHMLTCTNCFSNSHEEVETFEDAENIEEKA